MRFRILLGVLGGGLVAFSLPPWGWWPLAFAGFAVLDAVVRPLTGARQRFIVGLAFGAAWMLIGMAWMWFLTAPGYVVASLIFGSFHGLAAAFAPTGRWGLIGRPAAHSLVEFIRWTVPFGGVPLATVAHSLSGSPLLRVATIGGMLALTWLVFQTGALIAETAHRRFDRLAIGAGLAVVALITLAAVAPRGADTGDVLDTAAVQGGGEQGTTALEVPASQVTDVHLEATATIGADEPPDVVVWPENTADINDEAFADSWQFDAIAAEAARLGVPVLAGPTYDSEFSIEPRPDAFVNAAVVVTPDGTASDVYEKVRLVPFGEYVPLRGVLEALGVDLSRVSADAVPGTVDAQLDLPDGTRVGTMISWEVFFGDRARAAVDNDAELLINPTNGASYTWTIVQTQQVASSRLRAAETGRWVVQVAPTGLSAFVGPDGSVHDRTDVSEQAVIRRELPLRTGTTWYTRWGDLPMLVLLGGAFAASRLQQLHGFDRTAQPG